MLLAHPLVLRLGFSFLLRGFTDLGFFFFLVLCGLFDLNFLGWVYGFLLGS